MNLYYNLLMRLFYFFVYMMSFITLSQNNVIDLNGLKQGYWKLFFPYNSSDSLVSEEGFFSNNMEEGLWIKYHDNNGDLFN